MIIVYSKPKEMGYCTQCEATKRKLNSLRVSFVEANLYAPESASVLERAKAEGFSAAPVVHVKTEDRDEIWGGYRPDLLGGLVNL